MSKVAIRGAAYCLGHTPEMGLHYGNTPYMERKAKGETEFLKNLPACMQSYDQAMKYPPNQTYIGGFDVQALSDHPLPWHENRLDGAERFGRYGEIMPEDEFLGLMDICHDLPPISWTRNYDATRKVSNSSGG